MVLNLLLSLVQSIYTITMSIINTLLLMVHVLPQLPYAADALAPKMSKETIEYHYGKTSSGLCQQPEQPDPGHSVREHAARGDHRQSRKRPDLQQRRTSVEPYVLLLHTLTYSKIDAKAANWPKRSIVISVLLMLLKSNLRKRRPGCSARDGHGWRPTTTANCRSCRNRTQAIRCARGCIRC